MKTKHTRIKIHFLGAAGTVTGSKYLVETPDEKILVDCGLFQGLKKLRLLNREPFPIHPSGISHLLLTHAHLDHCGYIPRLAMLGFTGSILGTPPTLHLSDIILHDSARIQEEEIREANERGYSRHKPAKPLYQVRDVENCLRYMEAVAVNEWVSLGAHSRCRFNTNGHILGATFIELELYGKRIVFSGDIGPEDDPLLFAPQKPRKADVLIMESTYGDRLHPKVDILKELETLLKQVHDEKGILIVPSFAVERTQLLLYYLWQLRKQKRLPALPLYLDSPMGNRVIEAFLRFPEWQKLPVSDWRQIFDNVDIVESYEESQSLLDSERSKLVIAGSGMATGGRVLGYLERYIGNPNATVLLVGYQAEGTRGRQLLEGAAEIKLKGQYYPVRAKTLYLPGLSAHADQADLLNWLSALEQTPQQLFITHGEPAAADALRLRIKDRYGWHAEVPAMGEVAEIL